MAEEENKNQESQSCLLEYGKINLLKSLDKQEKKA